MTNDHPMELRDDEAHRIDLVLAGSKPGDRLKWLEDLRLMFGAEHLRKARDLKWRMERNEDGSEKRRVPLRKPAE